MSMGSYLKKKTTFRNKVGIGKGTNVYESYLIKE